MVGSEVRVSLREVLALPGQLTRSALLIPGMVNRASRVLEDVARIVAAVDDLLGVVRATVDRVQQTADAAAVLPKRVARLVEQTEGLPGAVAHVVEQTEALPGRVVRMLEQTETLPRRVSQLIEQSEGLPGQAHVVIQRASGVFDNATAIITEVDGIPAQLRPLVQSLAELDPGVATQLGNLIPVLGPLLTRLEAEVIPSVMSINNLVPVVELLNRNVDELQSVVSQMGRLISSVPGASMLRRRADNRGETAAKPQRGEPTA